MIRMLITVFIGINLFCLSFAQDTIEGRWHLVGYEDNVMYQFVDTELFADAGYRYTIYSTDGTFGDLEDAGGSPNPYSVSVVDDIITMDLFFGTIVNYHMNFMCEGQVVEFRNIDYGTIHSTHFREGYDYEDSPCNDIIIDECETGYIEINNLCFHEGDISLIQKMIDNSYQSDIDLDCQDGDAYCGSPNPFMDSLDNWGWISSDGISYEMPGNGNGIVEPLELGIQEWNNGRLTSFMCGAYIYCQLSGEIPDNISDLTEIEVLRLELNYFDGEIPESVCELENVNFNDYLSFDFSYNQLCPPYPDCIPESAVNYMNTSECEGCCYEAFLANENCGDANCFIPQCTEGCEWEPMQCWGSTGYCWCVDENGIEIEGTSQPSWEGFPDCEGIDIDSIINIPNDYLSIQEGIDAASDGDTILVHPGTYYGPIDFKRKNLVIGSLFLLEDDELYISQTIIMGADTNISPFVQIDGISEEEVELNGFTFQDISLNTFAEGTQSYVLINIINASPKIINNRFNNFQIEGQAESAVIFCSNSSSLIANNIFSDGSIALNYELTGWILSKNSTLTIKNNIMENGYVGFSDPTGYVVSIASENIIEENIFNNVSMGYCYTCAAIVALDGSSLIINNNLILRATGDGYGAILASESQYVSYNNTLIANNGGYANLFSDGIVNNDIIINYPNGWGNPVYLDAYSTIQISYSNVEGGYEGVSNVDLNPLFNDVESDDYSLQSESPCIDAGTADLDSDGIDDILDFYGSAPDMGACESEYTIILGDVNFDNEINILDVVLMVSFILGEPTDEYELSAADINQDGLLNILDIVSLINIILGS